MQKILFISLLSFFIIVSSGFSQESMVIYRAPEIMKIKLDVLPDRSKTDMVTLKGTIGSLIGTASNVEVFFYSSADLIVEPTRLKRDTLVKGSEKDVRITVKKKKGPPDPYGTWVRMEVAYYPDYQNIVSAIKSDIKKYPDEITKAKLLSVIAEKQKTNERKIETVEHNFLDGLGVGK